VRVLEIAKGLRECYEIAYEPRELERARAELDDNRRLAKLAERVEQARADAPPDPQPAPPFEGTWRDGRRYLPQELPDSWSIREIMAVGAHLVGVGDAFRFLIGVREQEDANLVTVLFHPHPDDKPVTNDETRDVLERLRGCGRFQEVALRIDGDIVPPAGRRVFAARLAKDRRVPMAARARSEEDQARLIERVKPLLGDVVARAHEERRPMRDFCVLIGAEPSAKDPVDGVVATRELIAKLFGDAASDPYDIRGRFDEPRPEGECVVFVKHDDGIEEMHVSLEAVRVEPTSDA
jgi:hypothetical protein